VMLIRPYPPIGSVVTGRGETTDFRHGFCRLVIDIHPRGMLLAAVRSPRSPRAASDIEIAEIGDFRLVLLERRAAVRLSELFVAHPSDLHLMGALSAEFMALIKQARARLFMTDQTEARWAGDRGARGARIAGERCVRF